MTILNMVTAGGGGGGGNVGAPTNLFARWAGSNNAAIITWTDGDNLPTIPPSTFAQSVLVRKVGSAPTSPTDGTIVVTETTKNTYSKNGYADTGLTMGENYYYRVFTYSDTGGITYSDSITITQGKTFTISWVEQGDMSSGWTYSDDAAGLTAGSSDFDEFFGYSAVRLNSNGVETAEITQAQSGGNGKLDITKLGFLTSGDNVMIKFPVRGIKMLKNGNTVTLSITDQLWKPGYQYYAFQKTGDILSNTETTATTPLYLGTYLSYQSNNVLKSWSGVTPQGRLSMANELSYASSNGTGWTIMGWYQRCLINAYYMMKYGNPDSQTVVGRGFVDGNNAQVASGGTDNQLNATYGETTGKYSMKLFGLENWWGSQNQQIGGLFVDNSRNLYVALHSFTANLDTTESQYKLLSSIRLGTDATREITAIDGTNTGMFCPVAIEKNTAYNTYYCDSRTIARSTFVALGGEYFNGSNAGAFRFNYSTGLISDSSRLMYL